MLNLSFVAAAAAFLITVVFLFISQSNRKYPNFRKSLFIAVSVRLLLVWIFAGLSHYDSNSYYVVAERVLSGKSIYPDLGYNYHPYFPLMLYLEAASLFFGGSQAGQIFILKSIFGLFDIGLMVLVYLFSDTKNKRRNAFLYALNPVSLPFTVIHGQFDAIPLFFLLLAVFLSKRKDAWASLSIAVGILFKPWPILMAMPLIKRSKRKAWYLLIFIIPLLTVVFYSLIYKARIQDVIYPPTSYRGGFGYWGWGILAAPLVSAVPWGMALVKTITNFFSVFLVYVSIRIKNFNLLEELYLLILLVLTFFPTGGNTVWITPLLIILKYRGWKTQIVLSGLYYGFGFISGLTVLDIYVFEATMKTTALVLWCLHIYMIVCLKKRKELGLLD